MISPYRDVVLREYQRRRVPLNMPVEMPKIRLIYPTRRVLSYAARALLAVVRGM